MSSFNTSDLESNIEFLQSYYEDASNISSNYVHGHQPINAQNYQTYSQHDIQDESTPAPQCNTSAEVSVPKISLTSDSSLKIELEIIIKFQNDQNKQKNHHVHPSTLSKDRTVNRMHPYQQPSEQNFRNKYRNDAHSYSTATSVPQLNRSSTVYVQNVGHTYQPNDESFY
ncbi:hypothetical protein C1645_785926 [Glomus cerebriforme]|uniref:Uncharacterized protein n=1 Tax=Glomus cerebriforme TaxID=658196 RepID=A0A397SFZ7_9GLOM|nr:hypothetical protein C1645_785926 [Glomus cerebriforme]